MEKTMEVKNLVFTVMSKDEQVLSEVTLLEDNGGVATYKVAFEWREKKIPDPVTVRFRLPCVDVYSVWTPSEHTRHLPASWNKKKVNSRLASFMPVVELISRDDTNRYTIAVSDVKTPISLQVGLHEETLSVETDVVFFTGLTQPQSKYAATVRIDKRSLPFYDAIKEARSWYDELGYPAAYVPQAAKEPMYSTWYSYLQAITANDVIKEAKLAKKMGMNTVILDDGWQSANEARGYGGCGDWKPFYNKFRSMSALADKLHAMDMKLMVWFSVPFVGYFAKNYKKFKDKYLYSMDHLSCSVLDPRYKDVRAFIVELYANAVKEWHLDGLKLDFIDRFESNGKVEEGMDFTSVEDATEQLLADVRAALVAINPEILLEFRQPYMGPVVSAYGNMIRVSDCPVDPITNPVSIADLLLTSGGSAVHSDMIIWNDLETPQAVGVQLFGTLFSAPQISVKLAELADVHKQVLKNFLDFRLSHAETIQNGKLILTDPAKGYGKIERQSKTETIVLAQSDVVFAPKTDNGYWINLTSGNQVVLQGKRDSLWYEVFDCAGGRVSRKAKLKADMTSVFVPVGGMLVTEKIK